MRIHQSDTYVVRVTANNAWPLNRGIHAGVPSNSHPAAGVE